MEKLCSLPRGASSPQANTTQYTYTGFGDVVSIDQDVQTDTVLIGSSLGMTYDSAGRMQSIAYPGNTSVSYGYVFACGELAPRVRLHSFSTPLAQLS